ncbi:MAG: hypothetical protein KDB22_00990 [Planctomycetales bacterium]|nr:hypothetical protein [Planctomycetales bacterium]
MSSTLHRKTFLWTSYDVQDIATAGMQTILGSLNEIDGRMALPLHTRLMKARDLPELSQLARCHTLALVLWVCHSADQLQDLVRSIASVKHMPEPPCRVCYLAGNTTNLTSIVIEAGAQIAVTQLASLQRVLPSLLPQSPLSPVGIHPITTGLVDRLPWKDQPIL